jgi:hypothetical protein
MPSLEGLDFPRKAVYQQAGCRRLRGTALCNIPTCRVARHGGPSLTSAEHYNTVLQHNKPHWLDENGVLVRKQSGVQSRCPTPGHMRISIHLCAVSPHSQPNLINQAAFQ